jgi:hypothetical protein
MNKTSRAILLLIVVSLASFAVTSDAASNAFIPPKYKDIILYAPMPDYPWQARNKYTVGTQGIYRLKINFETGKVEEIGVMKRANWGSLNSTMIKDLVKWRFKPGTIHQIDIPVAFEDPIRAELRNAVAK